MARRSTGNLPLFPFTVLSLVVLAILPHSLSGWVAGLRGPFIAVIAPIAGPLSRVSIWLREGEAGADEAPRPTLQALQAELDEYKRMYLQSIDVIEQQVELIEDLQGGGAHPPPAPVDTLATHRVARDLAAGTIEVRRGRADGVTTDSVVLTRRGEQLVGLVKRAARLTSTVHLLTDKRLDPPLLVGVVIADESVPPERLDELPHCQLRPVGDGTLVDAQFGVAGGGAAEAALMGATVRVHDESWPPAAQLLVVGRIVALEPLAERPLFRRLVVRPTVDVSRQRGMLIRVPSMRGSGEAP